MNSWKLLQKFRWMRVENQINKCKISGICNYHVSKFPRRSYMETLPHLTYLTSNMGNSVEKMPDEG